MPSYWSETIYDQVEREARQDPHQEPWTDDLHARAEEHGYTGKEQ